MNRFLATLLLAAVSSGAWCAEAVKPEAAITYRQSVYRVMLWNYLPMGEMVKGKRAYDAADFSKRAERVAALSLQLEEGFTPASGGIEGTDAKVEIWSNWADFKSKLSDLQRESAALAKVAKTGKLDDIKPQMGKTSAACKACHDKYRAD